MKTYDDPVTRSWRLASNGAKRCLIIFAKEPERGKVKTRLRKCLSETSILCLYKAFLKDTLTIAKKVQGAEKILAYTSKVKPLFLRRLSRGFNFHRQKGKNLGIRLHNAFAYAKRRGLSRVVVIGSDSPNLPADFISNAWRKLKKYDVVIGPSRDGGYYLIGLKEPARSLFAGIEWGSHKVLSQTLKRAKNLGKSITLLDKWYDVDDYESLIRLRDDLIREKDKNVAQYTRRCLKI